MGIFLNPNGLNNTTGGGGTPADVPNASTSQAGKVQLSNAIDSDSQLQASTPLAVKTALTESKQYTDDAIADLNIQDIIDNLSDHEAKVANENEYGHIKIDNDTLKYNADGQLYADIVIPIIQDGDLTQKGIVQLSNDIIEDETLSATSKSVFDALTEAKDYADTLIDDLESTLIKHSFELRPTTQGQLEFDMPAIYNQNPNWYITSLHFNSIKLLESQYSIVEKDVGDPTQGYKLVLTSPAPDFTSAIYELELIGGKALASGEGGTSTVISVNGILPDTTGNVELPTGLKLTKPEYVLTPTAIGQTEFDMPQEYQDNPDDYIYLLFFNTLKVRETEFSIQDVGGIKKLVVNNPIQSLDNRYDLVLIKGNGISSGNGGGSSADLHQVVDDTIDKAVSPKAVKDYIERFFYEGSTPPTNTSLFWHKV